MATLSSVGIYIPFEYLEDKGRFKDRYPKHEIDYSKRKINFNKFIDRGYIHNLSTIRKERLKRRLRT